MKQRSDYTFKFNKNAGRHGWLRLTPAYSIKLVKEILALYNHYESENKNISILDPFCGMTTTGIVAAECGYNCTLYDINPFLVWLGRIKSSNYSNEELDSLLDIVNKEISKLTIEEEGIWYPPMRNIERWWDANTLHVLGNIRKFLVENWGEPSFEGAHNLLWISFARLIIETSAADFNHISVSFKEETASYEAAAIISMFTDILSHIISSAKCKLTGSVNIHLSDSRYLEFDEMFDLVITSPPYPNRISYIRELRPYMYWLKFLATGEEAGELDWKAIGGTWGSATSKLHFWEQVNPVLPQRLLETCEKIELSNSQNGKTMSLYVKKFFDDLYLHFVNLRDHLRDGAHIYYILGNSSFYGEYVETDLITEEILRTLGYNDVKSEIIRKRNSKTGLFEYNIQAVWHS